MGDAEAAKKFVLAVKKACRIAEILEQARRAEVRRHPHRLGRQSHALGRRRQRATRKKIAETFRAAAKVAKDHGERLAAEGEICWAGMHSWRDMLDLLEAVDMPDTVGFQADMAHTYLYLLGYNAPEHALLKPGYSDAEFWAAYEKMTDALRPWTIDFHVAQNDGTRPRHRQPRQDRPPLPGRRSERQARHRATAPATG